MKKIALLFVLLTLPAYCACPIDENAVCTLPESGNSKVLPIFQQKNAGTNISDPKFKLKPMTQVNPIDNIQGPNNPLNYNSGCQFGNCLENPENKLILPKQN